MKIETMIDAMEWAQAGIEAAENGNVTPPYRNRSLISWAILHENIVVGIISRYIRLQQENARLRAELEQLKTPRCNICGDSATVYDNDPYMRELYPEAQNDERWWCDDCIQARSDDI